MAGPYHAALAGSLSHPVGMFFRRARSYYYRPTGSDRLFLLRRGDVQGVAEVSANHLGSCERIELAALPRPDAAELEDLARDADALARDDEPAPLAA